MDRKEFYNSLSEDVKARLKACKSEKEMLKVLDEEKIEGPLSRLIDYCVNFGVSGLFDAGFPEHEKIHERIYQQLRKMDLEGSEVEALEGARETIRKHRPIMAICVYHHMEDVLMVPRKVREIADGYKFYLRSGFHTECYCLPEESVVTESW